VEKWKKLKGGKVRFKVTFHFFHFSSFPLAGRGEPKAPDRRLARVKPDA
jgi:hypothetical protein